jgi:hypothetical protein
MPSPPRARGKYDNGEDVEAALSYAWIVVPAVMICVAIHHEYLVRRANHDPWKGGGFEMFADLRRNVVAVDIFARGDPRPRRLDRSLVPPHAAVSPTPVRMQALARTVIKWKLEAWHDTARRQDVGSPQTPMDIVRVVVRHARFDFDVMAGTYLVQESHVYTLVVKDGTCIWE